MSALKKAVIGTTATAGVALLLSILAGFVFSATNVSTWLGLAVCWAILFCGFAAAAMWDALDNPYVNWWRRRFNI